MINLTIDGKIIKADKDSTILKVAKENGIKIPTLCHHEGLSPLANCRLCVVEATEKGRTKVVTSCNYKISEGMSVATRTDNIIAIRKMIVELIAGRSPNVKIVRELADEMGIKSTRFILENEKCILCGLCVHVCSEYIGANAITFTSHGTEKYVSAPLDSSAKDCIGCGACVEICPAQCITMKDIENAEVYSFGGKDEIGPARLVNNWNARVPWKKCKSCRNSFAPPSPMKYLNEGKPLPKEFFNVCEKCQ